MQILDFKNKNIVLSDEVKFLLSLLLSVLYGISLIGGNIALYAVTSLITVFFLTVTVVLKPYLFLAVFFALCYPVSQTIARLEVDNLGMMFLFSLSVLAVVFIVQRKNFAVDKRKIAVFTSFYLISAVVLLGCIYGFVNSGKDAFEILFKYLVYGVIPASFLVVMPLNRENILPLLDLSYYLTLIIFIGFSIAYWFFRILNPGSFEDFFYGFANPIGTSLFMIQFILVSFVFSIFGNVSPRRKIFIYFTIALAFFYVMIIFQRSFIVAMAVALIYFIVSKYKISFKMVAVFSVVALIFALVFSNISVFFSERQVAKLEYTLSFVEKLSKNKNVLRTQENKNTGSIGIRILTIMASWDKAKQHAYLGNGIGTFSTVIGKNDYKYPHNIFYEFFYSTGLAGLLVFCICLTKIMFKVRSMTAKIKEEKLKNALLLTNSFIVLCLIILQFSGGIMSIFPHFYFIESVVVFVLYCTRKQESESESGVGGILL